VGGIAWPADTALVAILRDSRVIVPSPDDPLEAGDELLFVTTHDAGSGRSSGNWPGPAP
jgi:trk system potassium uptake protein TrkA